MSFDGSFNTMPGRRVIEPAPDIEDYKDNPVLYRLLAKLPSELRAIHMDRIEHLSDDEATGYLFALHERREEAIRDTVVSDAGIAGHFEAHRPEILEALETRVFDDPTNHIGAGTTARVKRFDLGEFGEATDVPEVAVKYLETPTEKTLSVSGEHDLVLELEQIQKIEAAELLSQGPDARVRVPHPYFYHRKGKTQCYAMELIDGINLERGMSGEYAEDLQADLRNAFSGVDRAALMQEIDDFFDTMHGLCLHGDVKPRNLMVSREGKLYVIDFGQSVLATHVNDRQQDAFEELKTAEKTDAKNAVRFFLDRLFAN